MPDADHEQFGQCRLEPGARSRGSTMIGAKRMHRSGLPICKLGFGGAPVGNLYERVDNVEAIATVSAAFDHGLRYFDTAPLYGHGLSERRIGAALAGRKRSEFVLSTKVGRLLEPDQAIVSAGLYVDPPPFSAYYDYSYDAAWRSLEFSLHRLGVNRVDIVFIHDLDRRNHGDSEFEGHYRTALNGAHRALAEMREQGLIAAFGLGVNEWEVCERFARDGDPDCFLLAGRYTLLEQAALNSFLPLCEAKGISVVLGGPYNTGILATGSRPGAYYDYARAAPGIRQQVAAIEAICGEFDVALAAAALRFPLGHPAVCSVIPGARSRAEVCRNIELLQSEIPAGFWQALRSSGLIREDAPLP